MLTMENRSAQGRSARNKNSSIQACHSIISVSKISVSTISTSHSIWYEINLTIAFFGYFPLMFRTVTHQMSLKTMKGTRYEIKPRAKLVPRSERSMWLLVGG